MCARRRAVGSAPGGTCTPEAFHKAELSTLYVGLSGCDGKNVPDSNTDPRAVGLML
jgi:hypothetical protein